MPDFTAIGLIAPPMRSDALLCASEAADWLAARGLIVLCEDDVEELLPACIPFSRADVIPQAIICMGGDGTILRAAQYAVRWNTPLLGINLGQLGFLAEVDRERMQDALAALLEGRYEEESRAMLEVTTEDGKRFLALNDAVVTRGGYARLVTVRALVDGSLAGDYRADGLIVATPTGSTGYSLAAGGPIISPDVDCMIITPICAHSLQHRPEVVPGGAEITLRLDKHDVMEGALQIDGRTCAQLHAGDTVKVRRAKEKVRLIRMRSMGFFEIATRKLSDWAR